MKIKPAHDNIVVRAYSPDWGSHLPVLSDILMMSTGPVLELGIGIFSTPFLHTMCETQGRFLDSYEDHLDWVMKHNHFQTKGHHISYILDWEEVPIEKKKWGIVFVDHSSKRRAKDAIRASHHADYVIIHDSNGRNNPIYHWNTVYPHFKYRFIFDKIYPHTTVLSNFHDFGI